MHYALEHRFDWQADKRDLLHIMYTDARLNDYLAELRHLKRRDITHLAVDEAAGTATRIVAIELDMSIPRALRRWFGDVEHLGWEEHSSGDFNALTIDFEIKLPHLDARIDADGRYRLSDGAENEVRRAIEGDVRIHMPVVAPLAERIIVRRLKQNMDEEARLTAAFLRERAA